MNPSRTRWQASATKKQLLNFTEHFGPPVSNKAWLKHCDLLSEPKGAYLYVLFFGADVIPEIMDTGGRDDDAAGPARGLQGDRDHDGLKKIHEI